MKEFTLGKGGESTGEGHHNDLSQVTEYLSKAASSIRVRRLASKKSSGELRGQRPKEARELATHNTDLPGGPMRDRPVRIGKDTYSSIEPPRRRRRQDGSTEYKGGRKLTQAEADDAYAPLFWANQPPGMREVMIQNIESGVREGVGEITPPLVDPTGTTDQDRAKLSAYRKLAQQLGFVVGDYKIYRRSGTAVAPIRRGSSR